MPNVRLFLLFWLRCCLSSSSCFFASAFINLFFSFFSFSLSLFLFNFSSLAICLALNLFVFPQPFGRFRFEVSFGFTFFVSVEVVCVGNEPLDHFLHLGIFNQHASAPNRGSADWTFLLLPTNIILYAVFTKLVETGDHNYGFRHDIQANRAFAHLQKCVEGVSGQLRVRGGSFGADSFKPGFSNSLVEVKSTYISIHYFFPCLPVELARLDFKLD